MEIDDLYFLWTTGIFFKMLLNLDTVEKVIFRTFYKYNYFRRKNLFILRVSTFEIFLQYGVYILK